MSTLIKSEQFSDLVKRASELIESYTFDNKVYGIGKNRITTKNLWVRKDIMDDLDLSLPSTMDELYEMLLTLKGYGEANDMHVVIFKRDCNNLSIFASAFGLRMEIFKEK